jgi:hypothetical protein
MWLQHKHICCGGYGLQLCHMFALYVSNNQSDLNSDNQPYHHAHYAPDHQSNH